MTIPESSPQTVSLLPFLHPSNNAPRLALTESVTDSTFPFAVVDDSSPLSRIIRGTFKTAADSRLKDVFLIVQRDQYRLESTIFSPITNADIEESWQDAQARSASAVDETVITLTPHPDSNEEPQQFAPLLFCTEKQIFMSLLCPSCGRQLELCKDSGLMQQQGLHPYPTSVRRYLYCSSCISSGTGGFFVREREDSDPRNLSDYRDLVDNLRQLAAKDDAKGTFPCASCAERDNCYGSANRVHSRLLPFSFYPFHLLIVDAPTISVHDFTALISGATCRELAEQIDTRTFPGRVASLRALEAAGPITWTNFSKGDVRFFPELILLKLLLLEDVVGRVAADMGKPPVGDRVWVNLPRICRSLPSGWNFRLLFTDDYTPIQSTHAVERNQSTVLAQTGLFFFQVLLGSRKAAGSEIIEAVRQYLADSGDDAQLRSLCVPGNICWDADGIELPRQKLEYWDRVCATGFALLDTARGKSQKICTEILHSLRALVEETREHLFSAGSMENESVANDRGIDQAKMTVFRVVSDMLESCRAEIREKTPSPPVQHVADDVVETIILRSGASPKPPVTPDVSPDVIGDDSATVIIPNDPPVEDSTVELVSATDYDLSETVIMTSQPPVQQPPVQQPPVQQPPVSTISMATEAGLSRSANVSEPEADDLAETVMIIPAAGRYRPGGPK